VTSTVVGPPGSRVAAAGVHPSPVSARRVEVTWIGHATALVEVGGFRVLTDPLMTRRVAHLRRRRPVPHTGYRDVDLVLLSHVHLDHLHRPSLQLLRPTARVLTPAGSARLVRAAGFTDVVEVRVGERIDCGPVAVDIVPAAHKRSRGPHSRVRADPLGFVVEGGGRRVYFPGDTDLFDEMADLGHIDVALLPIWGWGSNLGVGHLDPHRAATATQLIRPGLVVPIHWGTYAPEDGRRRLPSWFDQPPVELERELDALGEAHRLHLLDPGTSVSLEAL
jgi:L-ascorbate metabolism protein UlaG (beta-lactamase superfamily)